LDFGLEHSVDLLLLCEEFQIDRLRLLIARFIHERDPPQLIDTINRLRALSISTHALEAELHEHLFEYLGNEHALLTLEFGVLYRIVSLPPNPANEMIQSVFRLCVNAFDIHGPSASLLFPLLNSHWDSIDTTSAEFASLLRPNLVDLKMAGAEFGQLFLADQERRRALGGE
jgi:hypothetical protein